MGDSYTFLILMLGALLLFFAFIGLVFYVVGAIFLMKTLKNVGHRYPASAWVPIWNTNSLIEISGFKKPWLWTAILFGGGFLSGVLGEIPFIGWLLMLAILVFSVVFTVYIALGLQKAIGMENTFAVVVAVLLPIVWIIWMAIETKKRPFSVETLVASGDKAPYNLLGESDLRAPFVGYYQTQQTPQQPYSGSGGYYNQNPTNVPPQQTATNIQSPVVAPPATPPYSSPATTQFSNQPVTPNETIIEDTSNSILQENEDKVSTNEEFSSDEASESFDDFIAKRNAEKESDK